MPKELSGDMNGQGLRVAVVVARFNELVTRPLLDGAVGTLSRYGVSDNDISIVWVPGAFELPVAAKNLADTGRYDSIICLGAVIRVETRHYVLVAGHVARGFGVVGVGAGGGGRRGARALFLQRARRGGQRVRRLAPVRRKPIVFQDERDIFVAAEHPEIQ